MAQYRNEFPDFDHDAPAVLLNGKWDWEDQSWHNDAMPSFVCDVFVLWIDYLDPAKREEPGGNVYTLTDEGREVLSTDDWEDVRAFVEDGKRDFTSAVAPIWTLGAEGEYQNGFQVKVAFVNGHYAILADAATGGFILAYSDEPNAISEGFCFPYEADPVVSTLAQARAQMDKELEAA